LPGVYALRLGITAGELWAQVFYAENVFLFQVMPQEGGLAESMRDGFVAWDSAWSANRVDETHVRSEARHAAVGHR
jgi:hypothetical protein